MHFLHFKNGVKQKCKDMKIANVLGTLFIYLFLIFTFIFINL